MTALSTTTWTAHELGLAAAVGGTIFGRAAMQPALREIEDTENRDRVSARAWRRFSWLNLAAHGVFAATWLAGRAMLTDRAGRGSSRSLIRLKDGLVVASLATGIGGAVMGRVLGKRDLDDDVPNVISEANRTARNRTALRRIVGGLGIANLLANIALLGITTGLALERNR